MAFYHGVRTNQIATSVSTPVAAETGVAFVVGTAPVHTVDGAVNTPILCNTYAEAVAALGYSDDWEKYTLCEAMYSQFKLYGVGPVIFVNVLDPEKHKTQVTSSEYNIIDRKVYLPIEAIKSTVQVTGEYTLGEDYDLFYEGENLILEILEGGKIDPGTLKLTISYSAIDPTKVTEEDIIGGYDVETKKASGFELVEKVFPKFAIAPDILLAPGWSHKPTVAAVMAAKAAGINNLFEAKAIIDVDCTQVTSYIDVPEWKETNNINSKTQILCFPLFKLGDKVFHASTHAAGRMALTDQNNDGVPCESPSNKTLQIDSMVLADGSEVLLDLEQANYLNANGIVTALNFVGGFVLWGNQNACYPASTDVKDYFIPVSRTFAWVAKSLILTHWSKVDRKLNRRLIDSIVDSVNIWLNGLTAEEKLLGGRIEFREEENPLTNLMAGKLKFHIYLTPPSPAEEIGFVLEYDAEYITSALLA